MDGGIVKELWQKGWRNVGMEDTSGSINDEVEELVLAQQVTLIEFFFKSQEHCGGLSKGRR